MWNLNVTLIEQCLHWLQVSLVCPCKVLIFWKRAENDVSKNAEISGLCHAIKWTFSLNNLLFETMMIDVESD